MTPPAGAPSGTMAPLLGRLREAARADIDSRLRAAREEAQRLIDSARERLTERKAVALQRRREELARDRERRLHEAREAATREFLSAGERLVDSVVGRALQDAPQARDWPATGSWMQGALTGALEFLVQGPIILRSSHVDALELVRRVAPDREIRVETAESALGFVIATPEDRLVVDVTLERFLRAERPRLAQAVVRRVLEDRQ